MQAKGLNSMPWPGANLNALLLPYSIATNSDTAISTTVQNCLHPMEALVTDGILQTSLTAALEAAWQGRSSASSGLMPPTSARLSGKQQVLPMPCFFWKSVL